MLTGLVLATLSAVYPNDLLPDIIVVQNDLNDWAIGTTTSSEPPAGRRCIRFSTATANIGAGRFEVRGGAVVGSQQEVYQRVFRSDGTFWDRLAGSFIYHAGHGHIHFNNWTRFYLREVLPGGGIGNVVRTGQKTSFCILELRTYNSSLPGYNDPPAYSSCGQVQGLRPGRSDIYSSGLTDQYIDIEGLPDGDYWLEGMVDPDGNVLESDDTNNTARIQIRIGAGPPPTPDPYEEDDTKAITDARAEGAANSPNLGTVNVAKTISGLSMEDSADWFRFRLNATGTSNDFIQIQSTQTTGDIDLRLCDTNGNVLSSATGTTNFEQISLSGRTAGYYYAKIERKGTTAIGSYRLTIDPSANRPPNLVLTSPTAPGIWVERSYATVPVSWTGGDPDGDPKTVSLFIDRNRTLGPTNVPLQAYQNIPFGDQSVNVNTAEMPVGRWYLYGRGWDGGLAVDIWAPGWYTLYVKGDVNYDGVCNLTDWRLAQDYKAKNAALYPEGWVYIIDFDRDGALSRVDWEEFREHAGK